MNENSKKKSPPRSPRTLTVPPEGAGTRLDVFCASHFDTLSRNQIQKLNRDGRILVDGIARPDHYAVAPDETITVDVPEPQPRGRPRPQPIPLAVVFEDDDILVVNKPAGMVVHPAHGNWEGTVVNAVLGRGTRLSTLGGDDRPGVVHRLDKDTSGVMVLAKSDKAHLRLAEEIGARRFHKVYHAIVWGNLGHEMKAIDGAIARHPVHRQRMTVVDHGGREALTKVFVVDTFGHFDYIRVLTLTGRTHQIRVHLASISHPILGDGVYGARRQRKSAGARGRGGVDSVQKVIQRQALHASRLSFTHPITGERVRFQTAIAEDMRQVLETLHRIDKGGWR